ncbi:MAG: hypothetical protein A3B99_03825 [Candidatus Yanofskybacteria bacterium RIFCSPHIGHO2_02_FULL_44_12b]|uniref:D-alanine--D-alanine ligase n=2 Tax=Candidatus Yanofskyibacteriota TaxID=1752733 RepID=A0A1F8GMS0_9BACT|nr:MAG: D-alanine-D-alanine ligase [Candidatus Yanofskybacteria bacterium GW2011_GWA2_44_9]OGN04687.1 MAG: hypothetical protein A2659_01015 [Candidatus Yanofskybacteria bacterium RIFCSPHIGHO2_01_FULL_44_24]OGN15649.1 MAG: hypothetical protein A3B99_03825 [Candidatus Yanofskybacteria bacterium RIFCSPHIGHO2_02_FULL_44_12b]OGN26704.1 MAG: hypothetical protein A2925_03910 [Candidatus Yanofskybacteria bacterium RIFCSPLOWO2_01_FULL_44_22]
MHEYPEADILGVPRKLLKIGVLMGGPSSEHEVSLATGKNIIGNLDSTKYQPVAIKISKKGQWSLGGQIVDMPAALKSVDIVFNALHGTFGEDGRVQALMEYYNTPYTGSGITASALAMDKLRSREIFKLAGFCVPKTLKLKRGENYEARLNLFVNKVVKFPVVVKPCSNGSSVGVKIVDSPADLEPAIQEGFKLDKKVLVEEYIKGRELTCGVLDNFNNQPVAALPVTEITPVNGHRFFNYDSKYKDGQAKEITPAFVDSVIYSKAQEIALTAHQILGCRGYSRTDMIWTPGNNDVYILEVNTLPGLTPNSLLPKAAQSSGLSLARLLDAIIESSRD